MNGSMKTQCTPNYRLLTMDQIKEIHRASLELLETVGVRVLYNEAVKLLKDAGCRIKDKERVFIPNWLVEECIRSAPSRITIYNRKGQEAMKLEGRNIYFGLGTDLVNTVDLETGQTRPSVLQDVVNAARVGDFCEEIDFIASFALPGDVPTNLMYISCFKALIESSIKPVFFTAGGEEDLAYIAEMAASITGGNEELREKPFLIHYSEPTAPFTHSYGALRKLFFCAENHIPICYTPADIMGASTPVTLAGAIVQANAEALSGIVLHQLKCKGSPIISGFALGPMDMSTTTFSYSAPEWRLTNSAFADLYHYYEIPMWSTVGSDAHCLDEQAAMEHAVSALMAALDGTNLIHDIGYLGQGLLGNPASIVMCDEIISYVKRIIRGFEMSQEKMALDVIKKVGPGGNYLTEQHTVDHFRQELWRPKYMNRENPDNWMKKGSNRYAESIIDKTIEILRTHGQKPLPIDTAAKINAIFKKAEKELMDFRFQA